MGSGYNQPEIYTQYENASGKEKILLGYEITRLERLASKAELIGMQNVINQERLASKAELIGRQNVIQAANIASKRGLDERYNLKKMKINTYAPMGGLPDSPPPLTTGFGGTINFGGDTGNKNMLYVAGGIVALIIAIGVSFNVGRKRTKRRR
jgi:hypothetical protein